MPVIFKKLAASVQCFMYLDLAPQFNIKPSHSEGRGGDEGLSLK